MRQVQQAYIYQAEEKMMQLEMAEREDGTYGVRVLHGDAIIVPTTQELKDYVHDADKYKEIISLQTECLQQSEEKVFIAQQAYEVVDAVVQRLDNDLAAMEQLLQVRIYIVLQGMRFISSGIAYLTTVFPHPLLLTVNWPF
jgi:serine phosphatase RsbU (regulator of sigma subunit)